MDLCFIGCSFKIHILSKQLDRFVYFQSTYEVLVALFCYFYLTQYLNSSSRLANVKWLVFAI